MFIAPVSLKVLSPVRGGTYMSLLTELHRFSYGVAINMSPLRGSAGLNWKPET